jgi:hemoglobin
MSGQSLYEQLGGADGIEAVVAGFYERMMADPEIRPFFRGVQMTRQHEKQVQFFTTALGGPSLYRGKDMVTVHKGMGIADPHFNILVKHLTDTLVTAGVAEPLIKQVLGLIEPLRNQVVEKRNDLEAGAPQPERVADHRNGAEAHRGARDHRAQQDPEERV